MNNNYDKMIDMLCYTGRIPVNCMDALCNEARHQIYTSNNRAYDDFKRDREVTLFAERDAFERDFKSQWLDFVENNLDNFITD